jgi:hypothetical protein
MKKNIMYLWMITLATLMSGCDENEIMPAFTKKGTATATVATIAASTASPAPSQSIMLTLKFVNPSSDPLTQITVKAQVGAGAYTDVETFSLQSGEKDKEITQTVNYVVPAASGTKVTFDMVIASQKEYPIIRRTSVTVQ